MTQTPKKLMGFSDIQARVQILDLPLRYYVVLEKLLKFTDSRNPDVYSGDCGELKMATFSVILPIKRWCRFPDALNWAGPVSWSLNVAEAGTCDFWDDFKRPHSFHSCSCGTQRLPSCTEPSHGGRGPALSAEAPDTLPYPASAKQPHRQSQWQQQDHYRVSP